jgi:hypothetical protein
MTWAERWKAIAKQHRRKADIPALSGLIRAYRRKHDRHAQAEADLAAAQRELRKLKGFDAESLLRISSDADRWLRLAGVLDADYFARVLNGEMNIFTILSVEFQRRFPTEFEAWSEKVDKE